MGVFSPMVPKIRSGDLPVVLHNKYGMPVGNCRFSEVIYVPRQRFNLFSTTKLQLDGWIPGGDTEDLWYTRPRFRYVIEDSTGSYGSRQCPVGVEIQIVQGGDSNCSELDSLVVINRKGIETNPNGPHISVHGEKLELLNLKRCQMRNLKNVVSRVCLLDTPMITRRIVTECGAPKHIAFISHVILFG
jgi:hypothetical protein